MTDLEEVAALTCFVDGDTVRATVRLGGRLDAETVWRFGAELATVIRSGCLDVIVDLGDAAPVSAVCVGVLNRAIGELRRRGGTLTLRGADDGVIEVLRTAGLHSAVRT